MKLSGKPQNKKVEINMIGVCEPMNPVEWPSGEFLEKSISEGFVDRNLDAKYWQAAVRYALLKKYGCSISLVNSSTIQVNEIQFVQQRWEELVNEVVCKKPDVNASEAVTNTSDSGNFDVKKYVTSEKDEKDDRIGEHEVSTSSIKIDIIDFIKNQCCISNNRQMEWSLMLCPPGVQFQLHAHPNIELIYCLRGALYEVRMDGPPISRRFEKLGGGENETTRNVAGPELTYSQRSWSFGTLKASQWLVNEVGSIHKSFTSSKSDGGCVLLVLWGGSHANIVEPPLTPNVQRAVDLMDKRLRGECSTENSDSFCCSEAGSIISTTFLPESEKSGSF
jgi:hypothetical protein